MYILDMKHLKEGDVLLTSEKSFVSKGVRAVTFSGFSHAILYVGNGSYIHSDMKGVHSANIQRLLFDKPSRVKVLRPKNSNAANSASTYARAQIGTEYSIKEAVRTKVGTKKQKEKKQFCSRLVAESFEYAGEKIVKNPSYCSPNDIKNSSCFEEILGAVRKASEEEIAFANSPDPIQKQTEITNSILSEARAITESSIQTIEELTRYMISKPKDADSIVEVFQKSGYLTMWQHEMEKNPWRYNSQKFLELPISSKEKLYLAELEIDSAKQQLSLYMHNYEVYIGLSKSAPSSYIDMNIELYGNLVRQMMTRLTTASFVKNNA